MVNQSGVITNVGYPLSYETGTKLEWVIELEGGSEVVFTNISLNEYENEVSGQKALLYLLNIHWLRVNFEWSRAGHAEGAILS